MKLHSFLLSLTLVIFIQSTSALNFADIKKYGPGSSKIAIGSALLGIAASEGLTIKQFLNELLITHKYCMQSAAFNSKYAGLSIGAFLAPAAAAAVFIGATALGTTLVIKGVSEIIDA